MDSLEKEKWYSVPSLKESKALLKKISVFEYRWSHTEKSLVRFIEIICYNET